MVTSQSINFFSVRSLFSALYRQELWATSRIGRYTIENDLMAATLKDLRQKLQQMHEYGERVACEKQQMEVSLAKRLTSFVKFGEEC